VANIGEIIIAYQDLAGKIEGQRPLGQLRTS
jgi:hypothetical protein